MGNSMDRADPKLPALYLDWDGVVNFFGSRTQHRKHAGLGYLRRGSALPLPEDMPQGGGIQFTGYPLNWSAELLRKLAELPVEVIFLSTWRHSFSRLLRATRWELEDYRVLDWEDGPKGSEHAGKVEALIADQLANPRPFIWADDEAHAFYTDGQRRLLSATPQLLIAPDERFGLTAVDLQDMERFLARISDSNPEDGDQPAKRRIHSKDLSHLIEDFTSSLEFALGENFHGAEAERAQLLISLFDSYSYSQEILRDTHAFFGPAVFGQVLLYHMEKETSLSGQSESLSSVNSLRSLGMAVEDLGWPNEVLHPKYQRHEDG